MMASDFMSTIALLHIASNFTFFVVHMQNVEWYIKWSEKKNDGKKN